MDTKAKIRRLIENTGGPKAFSELTGLPYQRVLKWSAPSSPDTPKEWVVEPLRLVVTVPEVLRRLNAAERAVAESSDQAAETAREHLQAAIASLRGQAPTGTAGRE